MGGIAAQGVTNDVFQSQIDVTNKQGQVADDMKALAAEAQTTTSQQRLTQIQIKIDDDKRTFDVLKSINETLKGVQESATKFPQSR